MPNANYDTAGLIGAAAYRDGHIVLAPITSLKSHLGNARTHSDDQLTVLAGSLREFGFVNPVLVDASNTIIAGHGRVEAARRIGLKEVPTLRIESLSEAQIRAYRIADNRIAELAGWDKEILAIELQNLIDVEVGFSIEVTGFSSVEVDALIAGDSDSEKGGPDPDDDVPDIAAFAISQVGDLWIMGKHRLLCGSALEPSCYEKLLEGRSADLVCQDPPWNLSMKSISGSGKTQHRPFVMGTGEMSDDEFCAFLNKELQCNFDHARNGAVFQVFIDWRSVDKVISAGRAAGLELINICVWSKGHGTFGSPWRSAHELVVCFRKPGAAIKDRVRMGHHGRIRSNVWQVPGMGSFGKGRNEALESHPTSKPVKLLTEAIRDVTDRGDLVVDTFSGSGSCLIACEVTGRVFAGTELDPLYADTIVRRWQKHTGIDAVLSGDGRSFTEVEAARAAQPSGPVRTRTRPPHAGGTPITEPCHDE